MIALEIDHVDVACNALLAVMRERNEQLHEHAEAVAALAVGVGHRVGIGGRDLREVERAALLHDIGKVAIDDTVLAKRGALSADEVSQLKGHTLSGERMLRNVPGLARVARIVRASHERWDGGGYPDGLALEEIPLAARVLAVCDSFDAMTAARPYRVALSRQDALDELQRCAGTHFDPGVVGIFCALVNEEVAA